MMGNLLAPRLPPAIEIDQRQRALVRGADRPHRDVRSSPRSGLSPPCTYGHLPAINGSAYGWAARQPPGAYALRTTSTYGTGLTIARMCTCIWRSTVGLAEPPSCSPHTKMTSVPGSA